MTNPFDGGGGWFGWRAGRSVTLVPRDAEHFWVKASPSRREGSFYWEDSIHHRDLCAYLEDIGINIQRLQWMERSPTHQSVNPFLPVEHEPKRESKIGGVVYFVQGERSGLIKIGTARNAKLRLKELQTGSSERLLLLGAIAGKRELEAEWHARFASLRQRGEWFSPGDELLSAIAGEVLLPLQNTGGPK